MGSSFPPSLAGAVFKKGQRRCREVANLLGIGRLLTVLAPPAHSSAQIAWSSMLPMWLRKHRFIIERAGKHGDEFVVASRYATLTRPLAAGIYEGPIDPAVVADFSIGMTEHVVKTIELFPDSSTMASSDFESFPGLAYGRDILRRIPAQRGEKSDPYLWSPQDVRLAPGGVSVQTFVPGPDWRVLAHAIFDESGERHPVIVSNGNIVLLGIPLFDLVARKHWMPKIEHGYYSLEHNPFSADAELWLAKLVRSVASEAGVVCPMVQGWPEDRHAALTLRFDHDRDISGESLASLLDLLDRQRLKASWGFLARLAPAEKMVQVKARGHEIVLHTEAPDRAGFLHEVSTFRQAGWPVAGVTAHGGIGSAGHLGQTYFEWAADAGLQHADILSRHNHAPHPAVLVGSDGIKLSSVFLPPVHHSLDRGTAPDAHYLDDLMHGVPARLAAGDHVTIMNHPDIHRPELEKLLLSLPMDKVWAATHAEVVEWVATTRFDYRAP